MVSSGYNEAETMRQFQGRRVGAFLQKPYTSNGLLDLVARAALPR
jgi:hypothetical protein